MQTRSRSKNKKSSKTITYNFIAPLTKPNVGNSPFQYGPLLIESDGTINEQHFEIQIPYKEEQKIQGTRTISNIDIQLQVLFMQPNDTAHKYTPIFPLGVQLITAVLRDGQYAGDLIFQTYDSKWVKNVNLSGSHNQFTIGEMIGCCSKPQQQILDVRPALIMSTGTDNSVTQNINRVIIPEPIQLDSGDRIVVFFTVPGALTCFYSNHADYVSDCFCMAVNGTISYNINF